MSGSLLDDEEGVALQFAIWRYAVTGDAGETVALLAEGKDGYVVMPMWDRTARDLASSFVAYGDEAYHRVRDRAALPWVTEHLIRGHEPYSPL